MQDSTLKDGTYEYRAVQAYGPSTECRIVVAGGHVTEWNINASSAPAEAIARSHEHYDAALIAVLEGRTRYGTSDVVFTPAPVTETIGTELAARFHRVLGRLPVDHCGIVSQAIGRTVYHLRDLTLAELRQAQQYVAFRFLLSDEAVAV